MSTQTQMDSSIAFQRFQIRWNEPLGLPECPYVRRWVVTLFGVSLRVHHWIGSDDPRHFHDHVWDYATFILKGGYTEVTPHGEVRLSRGNLAFRKAEHRHTVRVNPGGCWSLLLTGISRRHWGFYVSGREKALRPLRYFSRFGHHPCED